MGHRRRPNLPPCRESHHRLAATRARPVGGEEAKVSIVAHRLQIPHHAEGEHRGDRVVVALRLVRTVPRPSSWRRQDRRAPRIANRAAQHRRLNLPLLDRMEVRARWTLGKSPKELGLSASTALRNLPPMRTARLSLIGFFSIMSACASLGQVVPTDAGSRVLASPNPPTGDCENKGTVIGETRGASTTGAGEHTRRAIDDARNKAAAVGANYLQTTAPQLTQNQYGPTGATVMATAFYCRSQPTASPTAAATSR